MFRCSVSFRCSAAMVGCSVNNVYMFSCSDDQMFKCSAVMISCSHVPPAGGRGIVGRSNGPSVAQRLAQHVEPEMFWKCLNRQLYAACKT